MLLVLRSLVFDACLYGLMLILGIAYAPAALWSAEGAQRGIKTYTACVLWLLERICGLRCEIRGPVPEGDVLVAAKHQSFLDILILSRVLPRVSFIMKKELRWAPILGLYALRIGSTPVDRGRRGAAMQDMVARAGTHAGPARQLVIYPQGTRVPPGDKRPYKVGTGLLYEQLGQPCVPAGTNVGLFWPKRGIQRKPGLAVVEFLPAIPPGLPVAEFMAQIETVIEASSDRLTAEAGGPG